MEQTETGRRLRCACESPDCTVTLDVEVFRQQDIAMLTVNSYGVAHPFRLSELRRALGYDLALIPREDTP
jgi:hypothetical protein